MDYIQMYNVIICISYYTLSYPTNQAVTGFYLVLCIFIYAKTASLLLTFLVAIVLSAAEVVLILYSYLSQMNDK